MDVKKEGLVVHIPKLLLWVALGLVVIGSGITVILIIHNSRSKYLPYPVSQSEARSLGYNIYYPNQKLLPSGYVLNKDSFDATNQVLLYSVNFDGNKQFIISIQKKPNSSELAQFYSQNMPLHVTQSTSVGTATIGAIKGETVISLPTNTNAWLLITAPTGANNQQISPLLKALELAK